MTMPCTCSRLRRATRRAATLYDDALATADLTTTQFSLLRTLERIGPASLTALSEAAAYDRTTLNRLIKPLQANGLVNSAGGADQRVRIVALTSAGRAALRKATPLWQAAQDRVRERLGGDLDTLHELLDRMEELRP
jgi:DNA-binding MarR family transcriptional regulator